MKTSYPTENTQIIDIAHGGTGATSAADARRNLAVPANAFGVGETSVFPLEVDGDRTFHARHDFDATTAVEIVGDPHGVYYQTKENDVWTVVPTAIGFGGTGATNRKNAAVNLALEFGAGATLSRSNMLIFGYITENATRLILELPLGRQTYGISGVTFTAFHGVLRGCKGYLDSNNADRNLLASPFSIAVQNPLSGYVRVIVTKNGAFTNVDNNTPVACMISYACALNF